MIHVTVSYRVKPAYVEENKLNIKKFLKDFQALDNSKFIYSVFLKDDGVTFVHSSNYSDEAIQSKLLNVPSFLDFQKKRDASGLDNSHEVAVLKLVGSSKELF